MYLFYITYPIYNNNLDRLTWRQHLLLLNINNKIERYFYYKLSLFCNSNYDELNRLIYLNTFNILKKDNHY